MQEGNEIYYVLDVEAGRIRVSGYPDTPTGKVTITDDRGTHVLDTVAAHRLAAVVLLAIEDAMPVTDDES